MIGSPLNSHNLKFLCSYGGRILPRYPDGKLRYHGGETRLLSVHRSISFSELLVKLGEMCGTSVNLRCQLPLEDLDALVSITSDEDLVNLIEEYDRVAAAAPPSSVKIRAFLSAPKSTKKTQSPPQSTASSASSASSSSNDTTSPKSPFLSSSLPPRCPAAGRRSRPPLHRIVDEKTAGKIPHNYVYQYQYRNHGHKIGSHVYVIYHGNHWQ